MVVLARHPRLVGDGRRREQREQLADEVGARRELGARAAARDRRPGSASVAGGRASGPVVQRAVAEALDRHVGDRRRDPTTTAGGVVADRRRRVLAGHADRVEQPVEDAEARGVGDAPDDRGPDLPPRAERRAPRRGSRASTIASMRSWLSDVITSTGVHARLALRRRAATSTSMPDAALRRGLATPRTRARRAPRSCTPTASPASSSSRHASMSRFSSNGSPTCTDGRLASSPSSNAGRREHARAADAVAAGRRAEQHREVARRPRPAPSTSRSIGQDAEAEHVHERVVAVACRRTRPRRRRSARRPSCRSR